jgi:hypothetical protein
MSEMKHTPDPWEANQEYANRWRIESCKEGFLPVSVMTVSTTVCEVGVVAGEVAEADAARIVACVNACAGIPNEALEGESIKGLLMDLHAELCGNPKSCGHGFPCTCITDRLHKVIVAIKKEEAPK